ncbi:hypothetical protein [Anaeroarcus burkinensis]|uniref:hypothetical protein n=1 Tax=Anaeroarcus burkinensis TaxID=82376 RepID=UPI000482E130|nr:hypothetical protein [Anaeroarcus burkinensis]
MNGINVRDAAMEVVGVLAKHNVPVCKFREVFEAAEKIAFNTADILPPVEYLRLTSFREVTLKATYEHMKYLADNPGKVSSSELEAAIELSSSVTYKAFLAPLKAELEKIFEQYPLLESLPEKSLSDGS